MLFNMYRIGMRLSVLNPPPYQSESSSRLCFIQLITVADDCLSATLCIKIDMNVIYNLSEKNIEELYNLYQKEWWTKGHTLQQTRDCVKGSQINIGILTDENTLIAYARVLTDFTFKALIFDVIVSDSQRGNGLGNKLIELIKNHKSLASIKHFELYCLPEMFTFYEKHGFSVKVGDIKLMRQSNA